MMDTPGGMRIDAAVRNCRAGVELKGVPVLRRICGAWYVEDERRQLFSIVPVNDTKIKAEHQKIIDDIEHLECLEESATRMGGALK